MDEQLSYLNQAIIAWYCFWWPYFISGVSFQKLSDRPVEHLGKVSIQLIVNLLGSLIFTIVIGCIVDILGYSAANSGIWWPYQIVVSLWLLEVWFYYSHLLAHCRWLYRRIHKPHHKFREPYALTGVYCSLTEMLLVNMMAVAIGPIVTGMSGWLLWSWITIIAINTTASHSGLVIPYVSSGTHDIHHQHLNKNYGILGILDRIHGTYKAP